MLIIIIIIIIRLVLYTLKITSGPTGTSMGTARPGSPFHLVFSKLMMVMMVIMTMTMTSRLGICKIDELMKME